MLEKTYHWWSIDDCKISSHLDVHDEQDFLITCWGISPPGKKHVQKPLKVCFRKVALTKLLLTGSAKSIRSADSIEELNKDCGSDISIRSTPPRFHLTSSPASRVVRFQVVFRAFTF